jgi:hypothetical protein
MSNIIALVGESGSGKSTSLRNLDPQSTYIISVLNKPLPFKGSRSVFSLDKKNYYSSDNFAEVSARINNIATSEKAKHIKTIIIDDFQYLMTKDYVGRAKEKGYDKWTDMAQAVYNLVDGAKMYRDDLIVVFVFHEEVSDDTRKIKTLGKMLNEKVTIEGMFTVVLYSEYRAGKFVFNTQGMGETTGKSPIDMFPERFIDNDLKIVIDAINEYGF